MKPLIIKPTPKTLRQEIESHIISVNKYLKNAVNRMLWEELLANCHSIDRYSYAWRVYRAGGLNYDTLQYIAPKND